MSNLLQRLRSGVYDLNRISLCEEAAQEIERLTALVPPSRLGHPSHRKLDDDDYVYFYEQDFYVLSSFSSFQVLFGTILFQTAEHAYHYMKFARGNFPEYVGFRCPPTSGKEYQRSLNQTQMILRSTSAHEAFRLAQEMKDYRRPDWDNIKVSVMRDILCEKVAQHEYVKRKLLSTGHRMLVEDSWRDSFWGSGNDGKGQNQLGRLWMDIRSILQEGLKLKADSSASQA